MTHRYVRSLWMILGLLVLLPSLAWAQVEASLSATTQSIQPGGQTTLVLRLDHERTWHTYWKNPGTGLPTSITFDLPKGWSAGEIQWPTPHLVKDTSGNVTGHGYEDVLLLPITLTASAAAQEGSTSSIQANAKWLMCAKVCIPGKAALSLALPVAAETPAATSTAAMLAKVSFPEAADGWQLAAHRTDTTATVHAQAPEAVTDVRFFPAEKFVQHDVPQTLVASGNKAKVSMGLSQGRAVSDTLTGVLAFHDQSGAYRSVPVRAPFVSEAQAETEAGTAGLVAEASTTGGTAGTQAAAELSIGLLLFAFVGGLILNLMPCVFPVLGIKIVGFVEQAGNDRKKITMHSLIFTLGVVLSFWVLAALLAALREGGESLGWGFQLQSAPFVFVLAIIMLVFALNLSGLFDIGNRATSIGQDLQNQEGLAGSFFTGVLATVVATPCSAPFLASALGATLTLPIWQSFVVFTVIGLGLSLPYLLLSVFPGLVNRLPRPGRWMETFKQLMAFPLYATVAYLMWVLAGQVEANNFLNAMFALVLVAVAMWLYGRYAGLSASAKSKGIAIALALALLGGSVYLGWPKSLSKLDVVWEPWSTERVAALRAEGRPIYVDFTARWCATCQVNKKVVFSSQKVRDYFEANNVATLKADWTNSDATITAELERWNRSAVPFNLAYPADGGEPKELPEILTPGIVLKAYQTP